MAIALAHNHGTTNLTLTGTTITKQPTATIPVGSHLIVAVGTNTTALTVSAADTQSNTYQTDVATSSSRAPYIISSRITTELTTADTVTVTYSGTAGQRLMGLYEFSGLASSTWLDQINQGSGTGTAPNSGNVVTTQADELLFGHERNNAAGSTYAPGGGFSLLDNIQNGQWMATSYLIVSATGTYAASGTITSTGWTQSIATYRAPAVSATTRKLAMLGVG